MLSEKYRILCWQLSYGQTSGFCTVTCIQTRNVQYADLDKTKIVLMIACFSWFMCELWSFQSNTIKSLLCLESRCATIQISDKVSSFSSKQSYFFPPCPSKNRLQLCSLLPNQFRLPDL